MYSELKRNQEDDMITSIIDNDLYKFTMQQVVHKHFNDVHVEYDLSVRNGVDLRPFIDKIRSKIRDLDALRLMPEEYEFLLSIGYLTKDYVDWLHRFQYNTLEHISIVEGEDNIKITIKGRWLDTILYEVPILAILSEINSKLDENEIEFERISMKNTLAKIKYIKSFNDKTFKFADFGTRRRASSMIQDTVIRLFLTNLPDNFVGTSNVYFAMKYNIKPIGTMAHEIFMAGQALFPLPTHQADMLYLWAKTFKGNLGIALSDTLGSDLFMKDFTLDLAKMFDGTRQDSGDPYVYADKMIAHYEKLGIDPMTKTIVFSDALDFFKAMDLHITYKGKVIHSFGIGTNCTNDVGVIPPSIVIKMQLCNNIPVVKLSDTPAKAKGRDKNYLEFIKAFVKKSIT